MPTSFITIPLPRYHTPRAHHCPTNSSLSRRPTNNLQALRMSHMLPADMLVANANPGAASAQAAAKGASEHVSAAAVAETETETFTNPLNGRVHSWCMGRESVEKTISAIGKGEVVVVTDDEDRENEGDLVIPAQFADADAINVTCKTKPPKK